MAYLEQLKAFKKHMLDTMDELMNEGCTMEQVNKFYSMKFSITWNGKTIELENGADTFQEIEYTIDREIEELGEENV